MLVLSPGRDIYDAWCRISIEFEFFTILFSFHAIRSDLPTSGFHWRVCLGGAVTRRSHVTNHTRSVSQAQLRGQYSQSSGNQSST